MLTARSEFGGEDAHPQHDEEDGGGAVPAGTARGGLHFEELENDVGADVTEHLVMNTTRCTHSARHVDAPKHASQATAVGVSGVEGEIDALTGPEHLTVI